MLHKPISDAKRRSSVRFQVQAEIISVDENGEDVNGAPGAAPKSTSSPDGDFGDSDQEDVPLEDVVSRRMSAVSIDSNKERKIHH